jgi:hypothetical protein
MTTILTRWRCAGPAARRSATASSTSVRPPRSWSVAPHRDDEQVRGFQVEQRDRRMQRRELHPQPFIRDGDGKPAHRIGGAAAFWHAHLAPEGAGPPVSVLVRAGVIFHHRTFHVAVNSCVGRSFLSSPEGLICTLMLENGRGGHPRAPPQT